MRPSRLRGLRSALGLILALSTLALAGLTPAQAASSIDWPMYGYDNLRTGYNPAETVIGVGNASSLHKLWSFDLGAVTIMQPVLATGVLVNGTPTDLVFIGSEHGDFYALDASAGTPVWQKNLGSQNTGCFDMPDGIFGVSGSPSIDRASNLLYVVGGDGKVHALDLATGAEQSGWPVAVTADPLHEHTYGGVQIINGRLYAEIASYCDYTPYHGKVVAIDVATHRRLGAWFPAGNRVNGGGIWGPGGVSADPATGHVFAATGNALTNPEYYRYSENVVELSPNLKVLGHDYPGLTGGDVDFGATPILYQAPGCPPQVAAKNKTGVLVVYTRGDVSSGATQRLQIANVSDWQFNGIPAYDPTTNTMFIGNSSDSNSDVYKHGMVALKVQTDCSLALAWQTTIGPNFASVSPPTVANGVVYYGDGPGNTELAFNAAAGQQLWSSASTIKGGLYAAPMVVNGRLFVGSWDHSFYAFGP